MLSFSKFRYYTEEHRGGQGCCVKIFCNNPLDYFLVSKISPPPYFFKYTVTEAECSATFPLKVPRVSTKQREP